MAEDRNSKTEKATPKKRRESRKEGQIPRSVDVVQWGVLLAVTFLLPMLLGELSSRVQSRSVLAMQFAAAGEQGPVLGSMWGLVLDLAVVMIPFTSFVMVAVIAGLAVQGGVTPSGKALKPKWERISPKHGFKRLVSPDSLVDTAKAILRLALVALLVTVAAPAMIERHLSGGSLPADVGATAAAADLLLLLRVLAVAGLIVGIADIGFQRWRTERKLRMSKHEVKQETKQTEGNPEVRARRRREHQRLSSNQMLAAVENASVVVVNPIHVAVALQYGADHGVPRVVAKGKDIVAERIRERAIAHGVPLVENRSLAWILHDTADVDADVPMELYQAVAIVLAFVMQRPVGALAGSIRRVHVPPSTLARAGRLIDHEPSGPEVVGSTPQFRGRSADGALIG